MSATPDEAQDILKELEPLLAKWQRTGRMGEIAIVYGGQDWFIEERPREVHKRAKRQRRREGYIEKVG